MEKQVEKQMRDCDVIFMIPGRLGYSSQKLRHMGDGTDEGDIFLETMDQAVLVELEESVRRQYERYRVGNLRLYFEPDEEMPRKDDVFFDAFGIITVHKPTRFCVLEIYIRDCDDGVHIIEAYTGGRMHLYCGRKKENETKEDFMTEEEFLAREELPVIRYGRKRCAVFAYGDIPEQELINCIANEESPIDGNVRGLLREKVTNPALNRSQYEKVNTYVSVNTLLEHELHKKNPNLRERLRYQVSEIFFVEMLLMKDASTNHICRLLEQEEIDLKDGKRKAEDATLNLETINRYIASATRLGYDDQFMWPTVCESARLMAEDMGIKTIEQKIADNKAIVQDMIAAADRREKKDDEDTKKIYILGLAALSAIGSVKAFFEEVEEPLYLISVAAVVFLYAVYLITVKIRKKNSNKRWGKAVGKSAAASLLGKKQGQ